MIVMNILDIGISKLERLIIFLYLELIGLAILGVDFILDEILVNNIERLLLFGHQLVLQHQLVLYQVQPHLGQLVLHLTLLHLFAAVPLHVLLADVNAVVARFRLLVKKTLVLNIHLILFLYQHR